MQCIFEVCFISGQMWQVFKKKNNYQILNFNLILNQNFKMEIFQNTYFQTALHAMCLCSKFQTITLIGSCSVVV